MKEVLRITNLSQAFGGTTVLGGVNLALESGERLAVIGSSGSGKTTLLRLIAGLEPPTGGDITIDAKPASCAGEVLIAPEHRQVALVFQGLALFPHLRALDQIAFAARHRGGPKQAKKLLDRIGLGHRASARLDELSGGERQRIALARALAQEPKLLLMDEPFSNLDDEKRAEMRDLLRSLLESIGTTLILVTHSRNDALDLARCALVLERGRPVAQGTLESILVRPQHIAAVRALGLGQVLEGHATANGDVVTAFGNISTATAVTSGRVLLLVRPSQPRIVAVGQGVGAEVVSVELRPPDAREVRRVAVVRAAGSLLRVSMHEGSVMMGDRVHVRIDGACDTIAGDPC